MAAVLVGTAGLIWVWSRIVAKRPTVMLHKPVEKADTESH